MADRPNLFLTLVLIATFWCSPSSATDLQSKTVAAFDHYVAMTESQINTDLRRGRFFVIDRLPEAERKQAYAALRRGDVHIEQLRTTDDGRALPLPDGLAHHWVGLAYIPGVTLIDALTVLRDADHYQEVFKAAVRRSRLVSSTDNSLQISEQFYRKTIVTVSANADFDAHYRFLGPHRLVCESYSTRIAEVEHAGEASEHELPVGSDHGYLWRLNSFWHLEEKDGGVYMQVEFISLSRSVPAMFMWVVQPFLKSVPHGILETMLTTTRSTVIARAANGHANASTNASFESTH